MLFDLDVKYGWLIGIQTPQDNLAKALVIDDAENMINMQFI